jgi:hypothetical protein
MDQNADIAAVRAATQTYLDGLFDGDAERIASIFLPSSALTQVFEGELKITPRDTWLDIDLISPTLALVKVKCQMPPRYFTDLLSFVKLDGRWLVAQKVFTTEVRG